MLRHRIVAALLLVAPVLASAQRGGYGGGMGRMAGGRSGLVPAGVVTGDSVEKLNPISALIEKRKDIGMADTQVAKLGGILARLDARSAPAFRQLDSVTKAMGLSADHPLGTSDPDKQRMLAYHGAITPILNEVRDNNEAATMEAFALLTSDQRRRATGVVRNQRDQFEHLLRGGIAAPGAGGRRGGQVQ